jgi:glycerol-3-phosphate dehydrogenase (NAD(P)+)
MKVALHGSGPSADALRDLAEAAGSTVLAPGEIARPDLDLVATSAAEVRGIAASGVLGPGSRVILACRGLEPGTHLRLSEVIAQECSAHRVGALAGPRVPRDILAGRPGAAVVASPFAEVGAAGSAALRSPRCRVYTSTDLAGTELAGAAVAVLEVAVSVARALGLGAGVEALVVARGIVEGTRLCTRAGGLARTFAGLAGAGDLVACVASDEHPAHAVSRALVAGTADAPLAALCDALLARERDLPIVSAVRVLAAAEATPAEVMRGLMTRGHGDEWAGA